MHIRRCLLLCVLQSGVVDAATPCDFASPAPAAWVALNTTVATFRVPRGFRVEAIDGDDSSIHRITGDGVAMTVDYGVAVNRTHDDDEMVRLDGIPALVRVETRESGKVIVARWPDLVPGSTLIVTASFADEAHRRQACSILSSVRLLGTIDELVVLRTHAGKSGNAVRMRVRERYERTFEPGDIATLSWGKIRGADAQAVEIEEVVSDGKGGWKSRITRLPVR